MKVLSGSSTRKIAPKTIAMTAEIHQLSPTAKPQEMPFRIAQRRTDTRGGDRHRGLGTPVVGECRQQRRTDRRTQLQTGRVRRDDRRRTPRWTTPAHTPTTSATAWGDPTSLNRASSTGTPWTRLSSSASRANTSCASERTSSCSPAPARSSLDRHASCAAPRCPRPRPGSRWLPRRRSAPVPRAGQPAATFSIAVGQHADRHAGVDEGAEEQVAAGTGRGIHPGHALNHRGHRGCRGARGSRPQTSRSPEASLRDVAGVRAQPVGRGHAVVHQVRHQALGGVLEVVAVVHPQTGVVGDEGDVEGLTVLHLE